MRKISTFAVATAMVFGLCFTGAAIAEVDKGGADLILESTIDPAKKAKPAVFPHAKHQETLTCADCHHGQDAEGKQVAYTDDMKIEKCESCHNKAAGMPDKLKTFKDAGHANCKGCHKENAPEVDKKKCEACHPKKSE
ncbi:MAG: cytochrome c family protein [Proteobacteria bacterium]|nr:cytochrome c family protein [Pseudomonadota bacterium]MBU1058376.1 cytochrome c family protein [Pseudomonadota bacterium]